MIAKLDLSGTNIKVEKLSPAQSVTADFNQVYFRNLDDGIIVGDNGAVYIVSNASGNLLWYPVTGAPSSDITHVYSNSASVGVVTMGGNVYRMDITGTATNFSGTFSQLTTGTNYYSQLSENGSNLFALNASSSPQVATFATSSPEPHP